MAAIVLTGDPLPTFGTEASAGTTATVIQAPPGSRVKIIADVAIYLFNGVAQGAAAPAAASRIALSATDAAQGYTVVIGGAVAGGAFGTVCVAAQSGTAVVRASAEPAGGLPI